MDGEIHPQVRLVVQPYGSGLPLGFLAFGIGMFLFAALDAGWVPATDGRTIGILLATFVFPLELVATNAFTGAVLVLAIAAAPRGRS
jgi:hypothetical protein